MISPRYVEQHSKTGGLERGESGMTYAAIIERTDRNHSALVPDLPGCVATGVTLEEVKSNLRQAIA
jgi:hypothetical protein